MKSSFKIMFAAVCGIALSAQAQSTHVTSESCNCTVDTLGLSAYLQTLTLNEEGSLTFDVESETASFAVLHGVIDGTTPEAVTSFIASYPSVTTLVFMQMPGSANDEANLEASQLLKDAGFKHYLPAVNYFPDDAFIASGAVDMFLAGDVRVIDAGAEVGVHSWSDGSNEATDYPIGHALHQPYIDYYIAMGFSEAEAEAFYYFTINAAPASGIHLMTESELEIYKMRTCIYAETPVYTITASGHILEANLSGAAYQWVNCDADFTPVDGETNQVFNVEVDGTYAVEITEEGCEGRSECVLVAGVGVDKPVLNSTELYPVPVHTFLFFSSTDMVAETIQLFDLNGKEVTNDVDIYPVNETSVKINVTQLAKGNYIIQMGEFYNRFVVD